MSDPGPEFLRATSRRQFMIGSAFAAVSVAGLSLQPQPAYSRVDNKLFEKSMPSVVGPWSFVTASGVILPPSDALSDRLYDNLTTRVYEAPDHPPVMLLIAYNNVQNGILQVHRPEICYPAGGYQLSATVPKTVRLKDNVTLPARSFTATSVERIEQVLYFTRLGNYFPTTWLDQRLAVARANLKQIIPDGVLMRVSVIEPDEAKSVELLSQFIRNFLEASPELLRQILLGRPLRP